MVSESRSTFLVSFLASLFCSMSISGVIEALRCCGDARLSKNAGIVVFVFIVVGGAAVELSSLQRFL